MAIIFSPEVAAEMEATREAFAEVVRRGLNEDGYSEGGGGTI